VVEMVLVQTKVTLASGQLIAGSFETKGDRPELAAPGPAQSVTRNQLSLNQAKK
jgi:hypothetical protein